jgi:hypothetical protein
MEYLPGSSRSHKSYEDTKAVKICEKFRAKLSEEKSLHFAAAIKVKELILAAHQCKCAILR